MPPSTSELSSLASLLDELTVRVTALADSALAVHEDDVAAELYGVERSLATARRRIERLAGPHR
ncbi:MAG: hypothetical protein M0Z33_09510 [Actinomycetota bacterium]|nr:hypothetical protein [Actinomycetota bacterium]